MPHRNIRYRLYPKTRAKAELLNQCLGATRFVWNHFLAKNKTMMQAHRDDESNPLPVIFHFVLGGAFQIISEAVGQFVSHCAVSILRDELESPVFFPRRDFLAQF